MADSLKNVMDQLPQDPDEIALFLEGLGITGRRYSTSWCPMAVFLRKALGKDVHVGGTFCLVLDNEMVIDRTTTPENIAKFIYNVDASKYLALVAIE